MKKLSAAHIEQLYAFTRAHFVDYYDVQTELVDHLANGIEAQWTANPELDFEQALDIEFKKFGVFGFLEVVEEREKQMSKRYWKLIRNEVYQFCKIPKVWVSMALFLFIFTMLFRLPYGFYGVATFLVLEFILYVFLLGKRSRQLKKNQSAKQPLLLEVIINRSGQIGSFSYIWFYQFLIVDAQVFSNLYVALATSLIISLVSLLHYIVLVVIPKQKNKILREVYPEMV